MGSSLGPILANVFMVELEDTLIPRLHQHIVIWRHYVDDTFAYVKNESIDYVLTTLNSFHPNISLTNEKENNSQLSFLDVLFLEMEHIYILQFTGKIPIMTFISTGTCSHL